MNDKMDMSYEQAISRLDEIVSVLEKNEISLDDALSLFEEGTRLTAYCNNKLKNAKAKISEIEKE